MSDLEAILQREAAIAESEPDEEDYPSAHPRPAREPSQVYSIRIPVKHLEELRELAANRGVTVSALLREWILERLRLEKRLSLPPHLDAIRAHILHDVLEAIPTTVAASLDVLRQVLLASLDESGTPLMQEQAEPAEQAPESGRRRQRAPANVTDLLEALKESARTAMGSSDEPVQASG